MPRPCVPMLSFDPVADEYPGFTDRELADIIGTTMRTIQRYRRDGISVRHADQIACRIGLNPMSVWGGEWHLAEERAAALDCPDDALVVRRRQRDRDRKRAKHWTEIERSWQQWADQQDRNEELRMA